MLSKAIVCNNISFLVDALGYYRAVKVSLKQSRRFVSVIYNIVALRVVCSFYIFQLQGNCLGWGASY